MKATQSLNRRERVLLVGVNLRKSQRSHSEPVTPTEESLAELKELALSAGAEISEILVQSRDVLDPATLVGRGKLEEIRAVAHSRNIPLVIVDHDLTPVQLRNMEKGTGCRVIDRTQLILDIFATHARTREGQLQVELAQLNYLLPRLTGRGEKLSRLGGGIGTRGPGEQKLETDRRRIRDRVRKIERAIETVRSQRTTRRKGRQAVPLGMVALVGYTNAGKSTLFNALTHASVLTSSNMFATLDPTIRAIRLPSRRRVLLSDTVGFLRDLPATLIAAFRSTLEEVQEAALILHVTDISNPQHAEHDAEVLKVLRDLGVEHRPRLHVLNKVDRLTSGELSVLRDSNGHHQRVLTSAVTGDGLQELTAQIDAAMSVDPLLRLKFRVPLADGRHLALVRATGRIVDSRIVNGHMLLEADVPESLARKMDKFVDKSSISPAALASPDSSFS